MIVGVAWYRAEQYGLLRALAVDSDSMADTYEQWLAGVTKTMNDMRQQSMVAHRVDVDVNELVVWCERQGRVWDGGARSEYAAGMLRSG